MFKDFKTSLLHYYAEQKANNNLSENLVNPTRVNLKNECLHILKNRYDKKDDEVIQKFLNPNRKWNTHQESIDNFELDGFQALITFFKRDINIQKEENIKFLAWLINFEPRPYDPNYDYSIKNIPSTTPKKHRRKAGIKPEQIKKKNNQLWKKLGLTALLIIVIALLGLYIPSLVKPSKGSPHATTTTNPPGEKPSAKSSKTLKTNPSKVSNEKQCMFWNEDHYEAIACNQELEGTSVIALNQRKLALQKKITNLDTIGRKDIGRTWYFKTDRNNIDLFTDSGSYPLDEKRLLRPLTIYMLEKYILSKR